MEPRLPTPAPSPEMGGYRRQEMPSMPEHKTSPETTPGVPEVTPEHHENEASQPTGPSPAAPPIHQLPQVPASPQQDVTQVQPIANDNPVVAANDDLIEKAWVTKAKQVVQSTKSDPYLQEAEVSKLQADYLKKRYGKDIKLSS